MRTHTFGGRGALALIVTLGLGCSKDGSRPPPEPRTMNRPAPQGTPATVRKDLKELGISIEVPRDLELKRLRSGAAYIGTVVSHQSARIVVRSRLLIARAQLAWDSPDEVAYACQVGGGRVVETAMIGEKMVFLHCDTMLLGRKHAIVEATIPIGDGAVKCGASGVVDAVAIKTICRSMRPL